MSLHILLYLKYITNKMKTWNFITIIILGLGMAAVAPAQSPAIRILVVTGGHDYNLPAFEGMLDSLPGSISYKIAEFPEAFTLFERQHRNEYDVIVFYHMWQVISSNQERELADCIREGKPLVVLHHSICAFDNWAEYINIIGGKYFHRPDTIDGRILPVQQRRSPACAMHSPACDCPGRSSFAALRSWA